MPEQPPQTTSSAPLSSVDLKTPGLAAFLSWVVPGAGQIYQKRYFKGGLFLCCILGMFFMGVKIGEGRPVYTSYFIVSEGQMLKKRNYGYLSQFLVGAAAWPAMIQASRFDSPDNTWEPAAPLDAPFTGILRNGRDRETERAVRGRISLATTPGPLGSEITGRLVGTLAESGEQIDLELVQYSGQSEYLPIGLEISADPERRVNLQVQNVVAGPEGIGSHLSGSIPRSFWNWYQVPLQDGELQDLNARLGKRWELAMVLTWIAGLLNILAIWDAYEGPAYGIRPAPKSKDPEPA